MLFNLVMIRLRKLEFLKNNLKNLNILLTIYYDNYFNIIIFAF